MSSTNKILLNQERMQKLFEYKDGSLYWKMKIAKCIKIGAEAGFKQGNGYRGVVIDKKIYSLHRIIFLHQHGYLPEIVDHIDGDILNNRIENLRGATRNENLYNRRVGVNNTSGVKNVSWNKASQKWTVLIQQQGKPRYFGRYESLDEAKQIALDARKKLHGSFARHV